MTLSIEIKPDLEGTVNIIDYSNDLDVYVPEDTEAVLTRYDAFKYSLTCTINVIKYVSTASTELLNVLYSAHTEESDSLRVVLPLDGYYSIYHLVLPTTDWLELVKDEDLSYYNYIYVTDGSNIYRYYNSTLVQVDAEEVILINQYKTTISIVSYLIFSLDRLKHCYASISRLIMNNYVGKCASVDSTLKFNRDFLWMTINVISYYLEWDKYSEALIVLEDLKCHLFCPDSNPFKVESVSCGCHS